MRGRMKKLIGAIKNIIYTSVKFSIFILVDDEGKEIICVYNDNNINKNDYVEVNGNFEINGKYGERFKVSFLEKRILSVTNDIESYLSSSLFVGIGRKTAKKIIEKFGDQTLDIINNYTERLKEVEGIGEKKFLEIKSALNRDKNDKEIILDLINIGFSLNNANNIYSLFREEAVNIIREDPYMLIGKINGFGFKKVDLIGKKLNIPNENSNRVRSGIFYVLKDNLKFGNTFILYNEMIEKSKELLCISEEKIIEVYNDILSCGIIVEKEFNYENSNIKCVFLTNIYMAEYEICSNLIRLYIGYKDKFNIDIYRDILEFENKNDFKFSEDQIEALVGGIKNGVHIITGGPGTGKTTIIKFILSTLLNYGFNPIMVAPTGRAAKRMMETTGFEAKTIHRVLEISTSDNEEFGYIGKNENNKIKCDAIIIDEASMVDVLIASKLFEALKIGTKIVIVGDVDQLPSIGPGNFLRDIINSGIFPVSYLNKIYRQKQNSFIVLNAHKINNGEELILNKKDSDFYIIKDSSEENICKILVDLVSFRIPKFFEYKIDKLKDIQILSPIRGGVLGVSNLNSLLQENINPKDINKDELIYGGKCYRVGDKVMQIKNNYEIRGYNIHDEEQAIGVFNGDIGYIIDINEKELSIIYDDSKVFKYTKNLLSEIEHAYAITIHKSQGSEFPVIILPIFKFSSMLMNRNILYTAVTRAKKYVVLVGDINYLTYMIKNTSKIIRYSSLKYLFNEVINLLDKN